jgi:hypothetical protein
MSDKSDFEDMAEQLRLRALVRARIGKRALMWHHEHASKDPVMLAEIEDILNELEILKTEIKVLETMSAQRNAKPH